MTTSTEKLGNWIDKFINMGKLSFKEKTDFIDELIQFYADPSREEYEKCITLKKLIKLLNKRKEDQSLKLSGMEDTLKETTIIINFLIDSIKKEIDMRINTLKHE